MVVAVLTVVVAMLMVVVAYASRIAHKLRGRIYKRLNLQTLSLLATESRSLVVSFSISNFLSHFLFSLSLFYFSSLLPIPLSPSFFSLSSVLLLFTSYLFFLSLFFFSYTLFCFLFSLSSTLFSFFLIFSLFPW